MRLTLEGDHINYPEDCITPTADLLLIKILLNQVISTLGAKFMTADIKHFYLKMPLKRYEYVRLKLNNIPDEIIEEYKLHEKATPDGFVYLEVQKAMYWLPQAWLSAQDCYQTTSKNMDTQKAKQSWACGKMQLNKSHSA